MQFNSISFLIFFAVVLAVFYSRRDNDTRKRLLLVSSYVFYGAWSPPFVLLLLLSTVIDWHLANRIHMARGQETRFLFLLGSLGANLGLLGYFKYGGFLLENFTALAYHVGIDYTPPQWNIVLPAGISFYTFQSLSYTIDIYRRKIKPSQSFLDFAVFISFFPQLVAGPIVRAGNFLPQCIEIRGASRNQFGWGLFLLLSGLFAKVVLADSLLAPFVDSFYAAPSRYGALEAVSAFVAFSAQIFYDFSAYSTCAIGAAMCLGFALPDNFRSPYAAIGFSDFWRRWHISLSTWLRDYLYISLGGNRSGKFRTTVNLMTTMLIGGLWHGAAWQFVIWGGIHGVFLIIEHGLRRIFGGFRIMKGRLAGVFMGIMTFCGVSLAWVFFRAPNLNSAIDVFMALGREGNANYELGNNMPFIFGLVTIMLVWHWATRTRGLEEYIQQLDWRLRSLMAVGMLLTFAFVDLENEHAFIYFQF